MTSGRWGVDAGMGGGVGGGGAGDGSRGVESDGAAFW